MKSTQGYNIADMSSVQVTIVIVLYKCNASKSEAFCSLRRVVQKQSRIAAGMRLTLYDNSPSAECASIEASPFEVKYVADENNGGLASAYRYAFDEAQAAKSDWLLLLDQDTTLTEEYLSTLVDSMQRNAANDKIAAIVPYLETHGQALSPEETFFFQLRHQFPEARHHPIPREEVGFQHRKINAFNSGAAIKVAALQEVGGLPGGFHLDYLDHAIFHLLQSTGARVDVIPAVLQQAFSHYEIDSVSYQRHQSVLRGQIRFVTWFGTWWDRLLLRLWFLRKGRYYRTVCSDARVWKLMMRSATGSWSGELKSDVSY